VAGRDFSKVLAKSRGRGILKMLAIQDIHDAQSRGITRHTRTTNVTQYR
jgi:hypothetical protein